MAPPYVNLFMGREERTIILTFFHLIYFWKRFIGDIFFIFLGSHFQLKSLTTFMNTISSTIEYTFTYSKQSVTLLDVQALRDNMIILEDHILQAELNSLTRILFACAYPLHLIIKNIKKP